jgi:hypothetical protein
VARLALSVLVIIGSVLFIWWLKSGEIPKNQPIGYVLPAPGMDCFVCTVETTTPGVLLKRDRDELTKALQSHDTAHVLEMQAQNRAKVFNRGEQVAVLDQEHSASGETWVKACRCTLELYDPMRFEAWIPRAALLGQAK